MTDSEIIHHLVMEHFNDDNTFSNCDKGTACIYVFKTPPDSKMPEIEMIFIDVKTYMEEYKDKYVLVGIGNRFRPEIWKAT